MAHGLGPLQSFFVGPSLSHDSSYDIFITCTHGHRVVAGIPEMMLMVFLMQADEKEGWHGCWCPTVYGRGTRLSHQRHSQRSGMWQDSLGFCILRLQPSHFTTSQPKVQTAKWPHFR